MNVKRWRMILEFDATNTGAVELSRDVRAMLAARGNGVSVTTVEAWLHDELSRAQNVELMDAIHEMRAGVAVWNGNGSAA